MTSPYFQSSANLRRSPRKTKAAGVTLLTAMASSSVLPMVASLATPQTPANKRTAKRSAATVTPPPPSSKKKKATPKRRKTNSQEGTAPRTKSFEPIWSNDPSVPVHTLILGSHPGIKSLEEQRYYAHPMNAFWWIAGDCLGFRRASGNGTSGKPFKFAQHLRNDNILSYSEQLEQLTQSGFALWDVVASCERPGSSLDQDIRNEKPNAIREFCQQHRLRRIVLANGGTGCKLFAKHFKDWLESGELQALSNHEASQNSFAKAIQRGESKRQAAGERTASKEEDKITLVSALGVSPANARFSYEQKRDFWDEYVYQPGLADHEADKKKKSKAINQQA